MADRGDDRHRRGERADGRRGRDRGGGRAMTVAFKSLAPLARPDFWPYAGRTAAAARMAACCVLTAVACVTLQVPEAAVACCLVFFATRDDAAASIAIALQLIVGAGVGIAFGLVILLLPADWPMSRLSLMIGFTFIAMFSARASRLAPVASAVIFVLALVLTSHDHAPIRGLPLSGMFPLWEVVAVPMVMVIVVSAVAAPRATRLLRAEIVARIGAAAGLWAGSRGAEAKALKLLGPDAAKMRERLGTAFLLFSGGQRERARLATLIDASYELLALAYAAPSRRGDAGRLRALAGAIAANREFAARPHAVAVIAQLEQAASTQFSGSAPPPREEPLLAADALSNPQYARFALLTTLAAFFCYFLDAEFDGSGAPAAMATCYFVALSSFGETLHKLTLRLAGCLVGAALGAFAILVLMHHMTDIGKLAFAVGAVSFFSAWVSLGSDRVSFVGWQIALTFFLCTLDSLGPSLDLTAVGERILGIVIGNVVMTIVFTYLWPVGVASGVGRAAGRAAGALAGVLRRRRAGVADLERFHIALADARSLSRLRLFEAGAPKLDGVALARAASTARVLERLSAPVVALAEDGGILALDDYLAPDARDAAHAFEMAVAEWLEGLAAHFLGGTAPPRPLAAAPGAWLEAAPFSSAPLSAIVAAGRRLEGYRAVAADCAALAAGLE